MTSAVLCAALVAAVGLIAPAPGHAKTPPPGAVYQEAPIPAPKKRASNAANEALRQERSPLRVQSSQLQAGVLLGSRTRAKNGTKTRKKHGQPSGNTSPNAALEVSPAAKTLVAERAGGRTSPAQGAPSIGWPISLALGLALLAALLSTVERKPAS
jgi:hypothetical protein